MMNTWLLSKYGKELEALRTKKTSLLTQTDNFETGFIVKIPAIGTTQGELWSWNTGTSGIKPPVTLYKGSSTSGSATACQGTTAFLGQARVAW